MKELDYRMFPAPPPPVPTLPSGLVDLMEGLSRDVLKHNPQELYSFCADHMKRLLEIRDAQRGQQPKASAPKTLEEKIAIAQAKVRKRAEQRREAYDREIRAASQRGKTKDEPTIKINNSPKKVSIIMKNVAPIEQQNVQEKEKEVLSSNTKPILETNIELIINPENGVIMKKEDLTTASCDKINEVELIDKEFEFSAQITDTDDLKEISVTVSESPDQESKATTHLENNDSFLHSIQNEFEPKTLAAASISNSCDNNDNEVNTSIKFVEDIGIPSEDSSKPTIGVKECLPDSSCKEKNIGKDNEEMLNADINKEENARDVQKVYLDNDDQLMQNEISESNTTDLLDRNKGQNEINELLDLQEQVSKDSNEKNKHVKVDIAKKEQESIKEKVENIKQDKNKFPSSQNLDNMNLDKSDNQNTEDMIAVQNGLENDKEPKTPYHDMAIKLSATTINDGDKAENPIVCTAPNDDLVPLATDTTNEIQEEEMTGNNSIKDETLENEPENGKKSSGIEYAGYDHKNGLTKLNNIENEIHPHPDDLRNSKNLVIEVSNHDRKLVSPQVSVAEEDETVLNNESQTTDKESIKTHYDQARQQSDEKIFSADNTLPETLNGESNESYSDIINESKSIDDECNAAIDLETAAVTIQKVFSSFLFTRGSTMEDASNEEDPSYTMPEDLSSDEGRDEHKAEDCTETVNTERRALGLNRMDTVLQTVNEEKSLSLSDDSSTLSSAATVIQAHVRGFLVRSRLHSHKTASTSSLINSDGHSNSLDADNKLNKNKTVLNIHIVPEDGNFIRDESITSSVDVDLPFDGSPPASFNLQTLGHDISEKRKHLKREDAFQSVSPPSNNSGKSDDVSLVENDEKLETNAVSKTEDALSGDTTPTKSITADTVVEQEQETQGYNESKKYSDELDVVSPYKTSDKRNSLSTEEPQKLFHSSEFHDAVLPTSAVMRPEKPAVREFKDVLIYVVVWNMRIDDGS